jgi:hypothetical protein
LQAAKPCRLRSLAGCEARDVVRTTIGSRSADAHPAGTILATDSIERFARIGTRFLERPIDPEEVELIDL